MRGQLRRWVVPLGRLGCMARGLVFLIVGVFLVNAALHVNPDEARGLGGALRALQAQAFGWMHSVWTTCLRDLSIDCRLRSADAKVRCHRTV